MTPKYYVIRMHGLTAYSDHEEARKAAENCAKALGEEVAILVAAGITRLSATTTWLDRAPSPASPANWSPTDSALEEMISAIKPWSWPILPPGHSYLNPENLTVEQLGDGWRPLCTLDETYPTDHQLSLTTGWAPAVPGILSKPNGRSITYRTRAPIPTLPYNP